MVGTPRDAAGIDPDKESGLVWNRPELIAQVDACSMLRHHSLDRGLCVRSKENVLEHTMTRISHI